MFACRIERDAVAVFGSDPDTVYRRRPETLEPLFEQLETAKAELLRIHRKVANRQEEALRQAAQRKIRSDISRISRGMTRMKGEEFKEVIGQVPPDSTRCRCSRRADRRGSVPRDKARREGCG